MSNTGLYVLHTLLGNFMMPLFRYAGDMSQVTSTILPYANIYYRGVVVTDYDHCNYECSTLHSASRLRVNNVWTSESSPVMGNMYLMYDGNPVNDYIYAEQGSTPSRTLIGINYNRTNYGNNTETAETTNGYVKADTIGVIVDDNDNYILFGFMIRNTPDKLGLVFNTANSFGFAAGLAISAPAISRNRMLSGFSQNFGKYIAPYRPETDPYANLDVPGDDPIPGGGAVGIPGFPGLTATSAGVIGLFTPSAAQMQQLADFMWTDFGGTGTTVEEILQEVVEALKRSISNPLDYIIGLNIIPSQGLSIGGAKVVRFGFISSGVSMPQLANQYFTVDCGSLSFDTVCGDTFLDYAPYSKFSIYLPYIGFKDVDPNDFVGHTIGVVYHGDCVTGGVTAYITKDGTVMYQYSGCCALNVPLSADNWGETISAAINVATGIVAAAASGGAAGLAQGALKGAASVAANPSLLSPQVSHSGAVSGGAGCMGVQYPFVIREAVNFHSTAGFNKSTGYPAYYYKKLGDVTGFTTVIDAHLSNVPMATQDEIQEIESLLESGVIL